MKYRIKYNYDTGNSFNVSYGEEGCIELEWNDINIAKANLQRIKEHYKLAQEFFGRWNNDDFELIENHRQKDWLVYKTRLVAFNLANPNDWWAIDKKDIAKLAKNSEIGTKEIPDVEAAKYELIIFTDAGKSFQFSAPWLGHFESLNFMKIECDESGMEFNVSDL